MAYYVILDSNANLVDSFDTEAEARHELELLARQDVDHADEFALLTYGGDGKPTGAAVIASDLGVHA